MSTINEKEGYLELIIGPMFSGKTTYILSLYKQYQLSNMNTCVINYADDKRYDDTMLSTHDKVMIKCSNTLSLKGFLTDDIIRDYDVFLINEGHLFEDVYESVVELVDRHKKMVHVCGLDGDFNRNTFGTLLKLIPLCDKITREGDLCKVCEWYKGTIQSSAYKRTVC